MRKLSGFTLIELLIVVAIIAILAAIAVPNFLEAQIRAKVSTAKADQRTLATALEAFQIDYNVYPKHYDGTTQNVHDEIFRNNTLAENSSLSKRPTFANYRNSKIGSRYYMLTTPVSFIAEMPEDVFAETNNATFGYVNAAELGWMMWSYGPDGDEIAGGSQIDKVLGASDSWAASKWTATASTVYNPSRSNPLPYLSDITYDPTNGSSSLGDIWDING